MDSQGISWAKETATYRFDDFLYREMRYLSQAGSPPHTHAQTHLLYFLKGTVQDVRQQQTFIRTPATLILIPAGEVHATYFRERVRTFEIVLPTPWTDRVCQVSTLLQTPLDFQNGPSIEIALRLYREFQNRNSLTPLMLEGLLLELLAQMARETGPITENSCPRWLKQAQDFLHAHFTEGPSLERIATEAGVHPSHLIRVFRQHFRCTIGDYVRELRVQHARRELSHTNKPINDIALAVGYSDQSHFTTAFRRQIGISPGEYRRIYQKR